MIYGIIGLILMTVIMSFLNSMAFYVILACTGLLIAFYICVKFPAGKYVLGTLLMIVALVSAAYSVVQLNFYYTASGGIFGKISGIFDTNTVTKVDNMKFNFNNIELLATGNENEYAAKLITDEVLEMSDKTYGVFVNNSPCGHVENSTDYIKANYKYIFYNDEMQVLCEDTLSFRFAFYSNSTEFTIKTIGGAEAVNYWNHFFNKNVFEVSLKEATYDNNGNIEIGDGEVSYALANYYIEENGQQVKYLTQLYHVGQAVEFPFPEQISSSFAGWSLNGTDVLTNYTIKSHTAFYAVKSETEIYTVTYKICEQGPYSHKLTEKIMTRQRVKDGEILIHPAAQSIKGYIFDKFTLEDGSAIPANATVSRDMTIIAHYIANQNEVQVKTVVQENQKQIYTGGRIENNNHKGEKTYTIYSGESEELTIYLVQANFERTSDGRAKIQVTNENGDTSVLISDYVQTCDFETTGYREKVKVSISGVNSNLSISVPVNPMTINIQFVCRGIIPDFTVSNVIYGEKINLNQYLTADQMNRLKTTKYNNGTFRGFYTKELLQGTKYFDESLNMLAGFSETGYAWGSSKYEKLSNYSIETNTFRIYANYSV